MEGNTLQIPKSRRISPEKNAEKNLGLVGFLSSFFRCSIWCGHIGEYSGTLPLSPSFKNREIPLSHQISPYFNNNKTLKADVHWRGRGFPFFRWHLIRGHNRGLYRWLPLKRVGNTWYNRTSLTEPHSPNLSPNLTEFHQRSRENQSLSSAGFPRV